MKKALGLDRPDTLICVSNLATVIQIQGKYEQAEEINRRALVGYTKALGADQLDTLTCVGNLAMVLQDQKKYEEAEKMHRRALTGHQKAPRAEYVPCQQRDFCPGPQMIARCFL